MKNITEYKPFPPRKLLRHKKKKEKKTGTRHQENGLNVLFRCTRFGKLKHQNRKKMNAGHPKFGTIILISYLFVLFSTKLKPEIFDALSPTVTQTKHVIELMNPSEPSNKQ